MADPGATESSEMDLTKIEPAATPGPITTETQFFGRSRMDDYARVGLAAGLLAILAIVVLGAGWYVAAFPSKEPAVESYLKLVFTPIVGLVGSVVGFYFGSRSSQD